MPLKKLKKEATDYMYDHPTLRVIFSYTITILAAALSAFIYAYSYKHSLLLLLEIQRSSPAELVERAK